MRYCEADGDDPSQLRVRGHWVLANLAEAGRQLDAMLGPGRPGGADGKAGALRIDGGALESLDTAGANLLLTAAEAAGYERGAVSFHGLSPRHGGLIELVRQRAFAAGTRLAVPRPRSVLWRLGRSTYRLEPLIAGHVRYFGFVLSLLGALLLRPRGLRWRETLIQCQRSGLDAIPVITLTTMLIGVVVAYLLGLQAEKYGANVFVIDGVALGMVREFSPMLTATILAGRSGAAYTAQLGAMRLNEETDAIRMVGLSAEQVLVIPRVLGLVLTLPLLVFIGDLAGLVGASLVCQWMLELSPATFIERVHTALEARHFVIGLAKAPVFALAVAVVACHQGMTAPRDTRAIGEATTSTVVQGIVAVIVIDALFAIVLELLGL